MMENSNKPLVSICSITYNHAPYIRQCLDGMLMQQTDFTFEIIINDDCSTDGTTEIIREYAERYPEIVKPIFHEENQYQKGVRGMFAKFVFPKAKGKYIALCEGDDYWTDPLKLQKQVDFLEANPEYSLCFHNARMLWMDERGFNGTFLDITIPSKEYTGQQICERWTIPTASVLFRKEIIFSEVYKKVISNRNFIYGDIVLFLSAATIGKLWYINDVMSVYRKHKGGVVSAFNKEREKKAVKHDLAIIEVFGPSYKKSVHRLLAQRFFNNMVGYIKSKDYTAAFKALFYSFYYSPLVFFRLIINYIRVLPKIKKYI